MKEQPGHGGATGGECQAPRKGTYGAGLRSNMAPWTGTSGPAQGHQPRTGSSGAWPRIKTGDLPEGRANKMSPSPGWIIREGPRWVSAATLDWVLWRRKRTAPGWTSKNATRRRGQNWRSAAQRRKQEQDPEWWRVIREQTASAGSSWATWDRIKHQTTTSVRRGIKTKTREEGMGTKKRHGQGQPDRA